MSTNNPNSLPKIETSKNTLSSTKKIISLSKIEFYNNDTYSLTISKLVKLHKLIRSSSDKDLTEGIFNKILDIFITKNKYIKNFCIKIFKDIYYKIQNIDNLKIIRMFYQNDPEITKLVLKFIKIFYKFFIGDEIIYFYVKTSKNKYKRKVLEKLENKEVKEKKKYGELEKALRYLYKGKNEKCMEMFKKIQNENIDNKSKMIFCLFTNKMTHKENQKFIFEVKDTRISESLYCKIYGLFDSLLYKKIKKCYNHSKKFRK
ncbi:uncharacterized protein VNE69_01323 [Vairimorpha necatrix]|uniref:Uncharacterized protein n=1 Tax=Vairimorpha necatrix TaxID=6039 RepID=A0AAX4J8T7_9MICR